MQFLTSRKAFFTFSGILASVFLTGCAKDNAFDCVKSTGKIVTETRELVAFNTIRVKDNLNITLIPDSVYFAEVTCGENLQANVNTEIKNGELWIENINKCNWVRSFKKPMEVKVHLPQLSTIFHDGFGTIKNEGILKSDLVFVHLSSAGDIKLMLNCRSLLLDMYEVGNVELTGQTREFHAMVMNEGNLEAADLNCDDIYLKKEGVGYANLQAQRLISATINGIGNAYYKGKPTEIYQDGKGPGKLIKVE
jgi:hypothetical protein